MRKFIVFAGLLGWFALIVVLVLTRQWGAVASMLALSGLVENVAHAAAKE